MKLNQLSLDIIAFGITKFMNIKEVISLKMTCRLFNEAIRDDNPIFKIINLSDKKTEDVIDYLKCVDKNLDLENNKYITCVLNNQQIFYAYIPDSLKKRFIKSKILIMKSV